MDDDDVIYEMFMELMAQLEADSPNARMRVLSQNPRYAEDTDPAAEKNILHKR